MMEFVPEKMERMIIINVFQGASALTPPTILLQRLILLLAVILLLAFITGFSAPNLNISPLIFRTKKKCLSIFSKNLCS